MQCLTPNLITEYWILYPYAEDLNQGGETVKFRALKQSVVGLMLTLGVTLAPSGAANAEVDEVRIVRQLGLSFLPLMVMEEEKLFEKRAAEQGISTKASWTTLATPAAANEALLSNTVDIIANGPPHLLLLWERTKGTPMEVRGIATLVAVSTFLNTRNPNVKSIADFTENDRIAAVGASFSIPVMILQMAAIKEFGEENYKRLDNLIVTLPHPEGMAALLSGGTEVTAHFTSPPYQQLELKHPGIRRILTSADVMGGPATFSLMMTTTKFRSENPKAYKAFLDAFTDAHDFIAKNPERAADIYLARSGEGGVTKPDLLEIFADTASLEYGLAPRKISIYANYMAKRGILKAAPSSWKDVFFEDIHHLSGD